MSVEIPLVKLYIFATTSETNMNETIFEWLL